MKTIYNWIQSLEVKQKTIVIALLFAIVYVLGTFTYQVYSKISQAYTEYQIREDIKQFDIDKANLIGINNDTIKKYRQNILDMEACNTRQVLGVRVEATCEISKDLVQKANASESVSMNATGGTSPVPERQELNTKKLLSPAELFYTTAVYDKCHVSQGEEDHFEKRNGGMLATDVACRFGQPKAQRSIVYVPDYTGESYQYTICNVNNDKLLGDYIELCNTSGTGTFKWIIAHIETKKKVGDIVQTGEVLGQQNLSGATTGYHTHIELWKFVDESWINVSYSTRSKALSNRRAGLLDDTVKIGDPIYSTQYNLGDVNQNDDAPNIGASGKDLRDKNIINPIALTVDIRKLYGIKFGDVIKIQDIHGNIFNATVHDEMNSRFRTSCIRREGACIKMDIAIRQGEGHLVGGMYKILK